MEICDQAVMNFLAILEIGKFSRRWAEQSVFSSISLSFHLF
jgi:hypothetical protein